MARTLTADVTMFKSTRPVEFQDFGHRLISTASVVVGRFPTGSKLHRSLLTLWPRDQGNGRALAGDTAAVVDGNEYVADYTLYTHNRNRGRMVAWDDEAFDPDVIARWN